jgi:endo-1,4-beta-xylanase
MLPACVSPAASPQYNFGDLPSLRDVAAGHGTLYGAALQPDNLAAEPDFAAAVARECNLLVPENRLLWTVIQPAPDQWDFSGADDLIDFAVAHGMRMRGVPLVWHIATPDWVKVALKEGRGLQVLERHIHTTVEHYRGRIISWDVVNEAIHPGDANKDGLRSSPWLKALGPSYIDHAYRFAAEADPNVQLVYNDFGMEDDPIKAEAVITLLKRLQRNKVPLHAVGIQGHLTAAQTFHSLPAFCRQIRDLGLEIIVTELDVCEGRQPTDVKSRDQLVANTTAQFLDILFSVAKPRQILTWGLSDRHTWLGLPQYNSYNDFGTHVRGLPLDEDCNRKPMWRVLYNALNRA